MGHGQAAQPFLLDDDEQAIAQLVGDFAQRQLSAQQIAQRVLERSPGELMRAVRGLDLVGLCVPEAQGGAGLGLRALAAAVQSLAQACGGLAAQLGHSAGPAALALSAAGEVGEGTLRALLAGEPIAWIAQGGAAQATLSDPAVVLGGAEAAYALHGAPDAQGGATLRCFAVRPEQREAAPAPMSLREGQWAALRLAEAPLWAVTLDAAQWRRVVEAQQVVDAAVALGLGYAALQEGVRYAQERVQFGQAIGGFQAVQWMLADSATQLDAAKLCLWDAARGELAAPAALRLCAQAGLRAADRALQIHGGYGYTRDYPIERIFRDAHFAPAQWGFADLA